MIAALVTCARKRQDYDAWHRQAVAKAPRLDLKDILAAKCHRFDFGDERRS